MTVPLLIAHRGNLRGPSKEENRPAYIRAALEAGFDVEIDVWWAQRETPLQVESRGFYTGHDEPRNFIEEDFLRGANRWAHAKNLSSLFQLKLIRSEHFFWHQNDDFTLTTCGRIWTYPGKPLTKNSVCVLPEGDPKFDLSDPRSYFETLPYAICSDYVADIRENWRE